MKGLGEQTLLKTEILGSAISLSRFSCRRDFWDLPPNVNKTCHIDNRTWDMPGFAKVLPQPVLVQFVAVELLQKFFLRRLSRLHLNVTNCWGPTRIQTVKLAGQISGRAFHIFRESFHLR